MKTKLSNWKIIFTKIIFILGKQILQMISSAVHLLCAILLYQFFPVVTLFSPPF